MFHKGGVLAQLKRWITLAELGLPTAQSLALAEQPESAMTSPIAP